MSTTIQSLIIARLLEFKATKVGQETIKVGHTYDEVLELVKKDVAGHPLLDGCDTTKNCIAWYASKMRNQDTKFYNKLMLEIQRPRKSNKSKKGTKVTAKA